MRRSKLIVGIILLFLGGGLIYFGLQDRTADTNSSGIEQRQNKTIQIKFNEDRTELSYEGQENTTALATLKSLTKVSTEKSSLGEYVTGISGVEADGSKEFWAFYVNDKMAGVGADSYRAKKGDVFKWKLQEL